MSARHLLLPTPQGIGAGQTATLNLPLGPTYDRIDIEMKTGTGAGTEVAAADWVNNIDDIRLKVNGRTEIEIYAEDLVKLNTFYGLAPVAGVLSLHLTAPWARTIGGEDMGGYGTAGGMSSFTLEIDLKPGITIHTLKCRYVQGDTKPYGPHTIIRRLSKSFASVGIDEVADIYKGAYNMLGLHITSTSIGHVEIEADGQIHHDTEAKSRLNQFKITGRTKQAGMTHIDFVGKNRIAFQGGDGRIRAEAFPMALQDFRLKLDFTTAPGTYEIYQYGIEGPRG